MIVIFFHPGCKQTLAIVFPCAARFGWEKENLLQMYTRGNDKRGSAAAWLQLCHNT